MSARAPDYQPQLVEALLQQMVAILQRDLAANLALVNPSYTFTDVAAGSYNTTPQDIYDALPAIVIEPIKTEIARDEQIAITAQHTFTVAAIVAGGGDTEALARLARDYGRALVMTLGRARDLSDYAAELPITLPDGSAAATAGLGDGAVLEVSLVSVDWALKGKLAAEFARQPMIELAIVAVER